MPTRLLYTRRPDDVRAAFAGQGLQVHSVIFDPVETKELGTNVALVRLQPLALPWTLTEDELSRPCLAEAAAAAYALDHSDGTQKADGNIPAVPVRTPPDGRKTGDVLQFAHFLATRLMSRKFTLLDKHVTLDAPSLNVTVYMVSTMACAPAEHCISL